jgi:hypothetical protein
MAFPDSHPPDSDLRSGAGVGPSLRPVPAAMTSPLCRRQDLVRALSGAHVADQAGVAGIARLAERETSRA